MRAHLPVLQSLAQITRTGSRVAILPKMQTLVQDARYGTRRSGSGNGSGLSSVSLMTLKMVVLAPMPRASVRIATIVKPGLRFRFRKPVKTRYQRRVREN
jgi:hypothetical protein